MTSATVTAYLNRANAALRAGDCQTAQQALGQAWLALGEFSAAQAKYGRSPSSAVSLHKKISKALIAAGKRCGISSDPDSLMPPSGQRTGTNPDLLRPAFAGPGDKIYDSVVTTVTTIGIGAAVLGLGIGLWTVFKPGGRD